eukprot:3402623-Rhodomonas_salina.1
MRCPAIKSAMILPGGLDRSLCELRAALTRVGGTVYRPTHLLCDVRYCGSVRCMCYAMSGTRH